MNVVVSGSDVYAYTGSRRLDPALPAIVFVHGAGNDHSVWALQSRYFAHHGYNVLALDLPCHGRSRGEPLASVEAIAEWIPKALDAAGIGSFALAGHSLGSLAALECAARHGSRVTKLVLVGTAAPMPVGDDLLEAANRNEHLAYELITGWSYSPGAQLGGNTVPGVWLMGNAMRLIERSRPGVLHTDLLACHRHETGLAAAAKVRCPVLVILGERDIMVPPRNALGLIAALPDARVERLRTCGHAIMAEQPDAVLDALRAFL